MSGDEQGRSRLKQGTINAEDFDMGFGEAESSVNSSGHTTTPISQLDILTSPFAFVAAPQACVDRFAEVTIAQSMVSMVSASEYRI